MSSAAAKFVEVAAVEEGQGMRRAHARELHLHSCQFDGTEEAR